MISARPRRQEEASGQQIEPGAAIPLCARDAAPYSSLELSFIISADLHWYALNRSIYSGRRKPDGSTP
jgi:hypothetical protein